jgi:hypothetical protein
MVAIPNLWAIAVELVNNAAHSTAAGMVGVSLIFIYFAWIVGMALYRIAQSGSHAHH